MIAGRASRRRSGFTIVELLVAGFVLVVVLGAAAAFLAQQTRLQRSVQTRNELQDRVRVAMQFVTQDLALAGNPVLIGADGTQADPTPFLGCPETPERCLELQDVSATSSVLRMRYISSQFAAANSCRDVAYRLNSGVLERSDVPCVLGSWATPNWVAIAPNALGFKMAVMCSDGTAYEAIPDGSCSPPTAYPRSAIVSVAATSTATLGGDSGTSWSLVGFAATDRQPCAAGSLCFSATSEVLMPNLKE